MMKESATNFFGSLLRHDGTVHTNWDFLFQFTKIDEAMVTILEAILTKMEVKEVVFSIYKHSATSPDGFLACFYQECWEIIKKDLIEVVLDFFSRSAQSEGFSYSMLVLIPNEE